jgi:hypothetical protein
MKPRFVAEKASEIPVPLPVLRDLHIWIGLQV